jgi:hypothetical protein
MVKFKYTVNIIFCVVWLGTCLAFTYQANTIYPQESIVLSLYEFQIPPGGDVSINGASLSDVINGLESSYNSNVSSLQENIRDSAGTSFSLDIFSACLAFFGLLAQLFAIYNDTEIDKGKQKGGKKYALGNKGNFPIEEQKQEG